MDGEGRRQRKVDRHGMRERGEGGERERLGEGGRKNDGGREGGREGETDRQTDRDRHTDRQVGRQTGRQTVTSVQGRQTDRQKCCVRIPSKLWDRNCSSILCVCIYVNNMSPVHPVCESPLSFSPHNT